MPIILFWNALVAPALPQFGRWFDSFERSCFLLERWFEKRLPEAERIERSTSRFPVFQFYDEAVTAQIVALQAGALLSAPVSGIGTHVERALMEWDVPRRLRRVVRENQLLPELFRVFDELVAGVLASIDRFRTPTAATFDPSRRTAADLPGLAAMAFRAVVPNQAYIVAAARRVRDALRPNAYDRPAPATPSPAGAAVAGAGLPLAFQLDELARYVVAALLVLPALAGIIGPLGSSALLRLRYEVLDALQGIERRAFAFRRRILTVFVVDLDVQARKALVFLLAVREVVVGHVRFYASVGIAYLQGVIDGVGTFATQFGTFWSGLVGVVQAAVSFGNAVLAVDIGEQIHLGLVTIKDTIEMIDDYLYDGDDHPTMYDPPDQFPVPIGDLVMSRGGGARAITELTRAVTLLGAAWRGGGSLRRGAITSFADVDAYLDALRGITRALALPRAAPVTQPTLTLASTPPTDLRALVLDPLRAGITAAVASAGSALTTAVEGVARAAIGALDAGALAADRAATQATRLGSLRLLRRLTSNTDALLAGVFAGQETPPVTGALVAVAGVYAHWLINGGFTTIGAVLTGFIGMMLSEWTQHLQEGSDTPFEVSPTSPRHLLERARLGRVHTPEVRIVATGQPLGRPLAAQIADEFQGVVQGAYTTGRARLGQLLAKTP